MTALPRSSCSSTCRWCRCSCRVPASSSSAAPSSPSLVVGVVGRQRVVVLCLRFALRRADRAARLQLQGSLGRHLVAVPSSFPMPCPARRVPRQDLRQRETKRARSITRRRVHNATSLIMSTKRQKGRATVELADLSPMAQRAPSDAFHQSAAALSHLDWGPCGANPRYNQLCFPRQPAPAVAAASLNMCVRQPVHDRATQRPAPSQMSSCHLISRPVSSTLAITVTRPRTSLPHLPIPPATAIRLHSWKPLTEQYQTLAAVSRTDGLFLTFAPSLRSEKTTFRRPPVGHNSRDLSIFSSWPESLVNRFG
jgi:hypothetical protein